MIFTSKINNKGIITIPPGVMKALNMKAGDRVIFEVRDNEVFLRKA